MYSIGFQDRVWEDNDNWIEIKNLKLAFLAQEDALNTLNLLFPVLYEFIFVILTEKLSE